MFKKSDGPTVDGPKTPTNIGRTRSSRILGSIEEAKPIDVTLLLYHVGTATCASRYADACLYMENNEHRLITDLGTVENDVPFIKVQPATGLALLPSDKGMPTVLHLTLPKHPFVDVRGSFTSHFYSAVHNLKNELNTSVFGRASSIEPFAPSLTPVPDKVESVYRVEGPRLEMIVEPADCR